jgi:hypothetical protein
MLAGFYGALAAMLAVVGLYGMISFSVAQRRQERSASGRARRAASAGNRHADARGGRAARDRLVVGAGLSLLAGPSASTLLFGLKPNDPFTLVAACAAGSRR